jgi:hypothetical protein
MQQEHRGTLDGTYVPEPRTTAHDDDVAVGTAQATDQDPHEDTDESADERYPAGTYASGSAAAGTDRGDVEVVDHDKALAEESAEEPADQRDVLAPRTDEDVIGERVDEDVREEEAAASPDAEAEAEADDTVAAGESSQGLLPGAVEATPIGAVWAEGAADGLRDRWRELQLRFIDDPRSVAGEADQLVGEAVASVTAALQAQREQLSSWQGEGGDDTERLRAAVRQYRDFFDRLLGL